MYMRIVFILWEWKQSSISFVEAEDLPMFFLKMVSNQVILVHVLLNETLSILHMNSAWHGYPASGIIQNVCHTK